MKTITFYSYKGGVGRSLALSNIAIKLSQLKKKVCVLDFDLDAPGLIFKFKEAYDCHPNDGLLGLVDYIHDYSVKGTLPDRVSDFIHVLQPKNVKDGNIHLFSAGEFSENDYWRKLSAIRWADLFYSPKSQGIRFFLDLKAKIQKELNPDFLLIDSRTGITDISGITLRLFADEVVILAVNNDENKFGSKKIISSLTSIENDLLRKKPKLHFALTRLPFPKDATEKDLEYQIVQQWRSDLVESFGSRDFDFSIIHADKEVERNEIVKISLTDKTNTITFDYLKLFEKLTSGMLSKNNHSVFASLKEAEISFNKALLEKDSIIKLGYLDEAIRLDPNRHEYYKERGILFYTFKNAEKAIKDFDKVLKLNPQDRDAHSFLGNLFYNKKKYDDALSHLNKSNNNPLNSLLTALTLRNQGKIQEAVETLNDAIERFPSQPDLLNARADFYRHTKQYDLGIRDIYKALEIAPDYALLFATLAELQFDKGNIEEFYLNLTVALSKNLTEKQLTGAKDVYKKVKEEPRFKQLLERYQLRAEQIFEDSSQK